MKTRLSIVAAIAVLTGCDPGPLDADAGQETAACLDGACLGELECLSNLCVAPDDADTDGGGDGGGDDSGDGSGNSGNDSGGDSGNDSGGDSGNDSSDSGDDSAGGDDSGGDDSGDDTGDVACEVPDHTSCDANNPNLARALGLCDGAFDISTEGVPTTRGIRIGFGNTDRWAPTEGSAFAVIGSGLVVDLDLETPPDDEPNNPTHCNDNTDSPDVGSSLPAPMQHTAVAGNCANNSDLIGTGDCSGTIQPAFGGSSANDFSAIHIAATVPEGVRSVSYDFAFFTTEYPYYVDGAFNDMHVAWLESEMWTGNIAYDLAGRAVSADSGFLDVTDDAGTSDAFAGTCMRGHAGTDWIRSTAPVAPGEDIALVFAVFDVSDAILDSYAFLDNVSWGCDDVSEPISIKVPN